MKGIRVLVVLKNDGISKTDILRSAHGRPQREENSQTRDSFPEQDGHLKTARLRD